MASSDNAQSSGLGAQLLYWGVLRLPPSPAPQLVGSPIRGPLKSTRKGER